MPAQSTIKVDVISSVSGLEPVQLPNGDTIPAGKPLTAPSNVNVVGVATVGILSSTDITCTSISAQSFVGDGSGLTNLPK